MTYYHAVFEDECGGEFGAGCEAKFWEEAYQSLSESYPESRIVQLEDPDQARKREQELYDSVFEELDDFVLDDMGGDEFDDDE